MTYLNCNETINHAVQALVPHAVEAITGGGMDYWLVRGEDCVDIVLSDTGDAGSPWVDEDTDNPLLVDATLAAFHMDSDGNWQHLHTLKTGTAIECIQVMAKLEYVTRDVRHIQLAARGDDPELTF